MKSSFSIRFYLKSQPKKDGLYPIVVSITINGQRTDFNSTQNINANEWDRLHSRVAGKTPRANSINLVLDVIKADLVEKYNYHHILRREPVNAKRLRSLYLGTDTKPSTLIANFDSFNNTQEKIVGKGVARSTHNKYTLTRRRLHSFILSKHRKDDISMDSISMAKKNFLLGKGERLTENVTIATSGAPKDPPYTFDEAKNRLQPIGLSRLKPNAEETRGNGKTVFMAKKTLEVPLANFNPPRGTVVANKGDTFDHCKATGRYNKQIAGPRKESRYPYLPSRISSGPYRASTHR